MAVEGIEQQAKITQENRFLQKLPLLKSSRECSLEIRFGRQRIRDDIRELDLSKSGEELETLFWMERIKKEKFWHLENIFIKKMSEMRKKIL